MRRYLQQLVPRRLATRLTVPKGACINDIKTDTDVGDLSLDAITVKRFICEANVGDVTTKHCHLGSTNITADVGDIVIQDTVIDNVYSYADVGNIYMRNVTLKDVDADQKSGISGLILNKL